MTHNELFVKYFNQFVSKEGLSFNQVKHNVKTKRVKDCIKEIKLIDKFRLRHYWMSEEMVCKQFGLKKEFIHNALYYKKNTYDY